LKRSGV